MLISNKKIAIIGGGPGGLILARLLQLKGVAVKVYERDVNKEARVQGATLDLHQHNGLKAIRAAGLMDTFKATYRPGADRGRLLDKKGNILYDEHLNPKKEDLDSEFARPEIDRGPLRHMLLNSLEPATVVWDSQFKNMAWVDGQWKLEFKNGTTAAADLVIGADGANSKVRPFVTGIKASYSGYTILQVNIENAASAVPDFHRLLKGGKLYVFEDGKFLHLSAKGDGSLDLYISSKRDESWAKNNGIDFTDRKQFIDWFKNEFPGWDSMWLKLFENATLPAILRPQYVIPFDQSWEAKPNVTLLGDAAHIMPPSGEGVNLAMLDALELTECLTGSDYDDLQTAIAAYERSMQERGTAEARESIEMTGWMHAEGANEKMVSMISGEV